VKQQITLGNPKQAVSAGLQALSVFGIKISSKPSILSVLKEVMLAKWNLGRRKVQGLIDMPLIEDVEKLTTMKIMIELSGPAYTLGLENLFAVLALKQVNLALRYGNSPETASSYCVYGVLLNGAFGDFKTSFEFGKLAVKLNEKLDDQEFRCKIISLYANYMHIWNHHWNTTFPIYQKAIEAGLQSGDLLYTGYALGFSLKWNTSLTLKESSELGERIVVP